MRKKGSRRAARSDRIPCHRVITNATRVITRAVWMAVWKSSDRFTLYKVSHVSGLALVETTVLNKLLFRQDGVLQRAQPIYCNLNYIAWQQRTNARRSASEEQVAGFQCHD